MPVSDSAVFKFNFQVDDDDNSDDDGSEVENTQLNRNCTFIPTIIKDENMNQSGIELEPFKIIDYKALNISTTFKKEFIHTWKHLKYINVTSIISNHVSQQLNTDLVKYKYEGGFKLWECSEDLVEFMTSDLQFVENNVRNKNVLELVCGHSLPAVHCLLNGGANCCAFQDYVSFWNFTII